MKYITTGCFTNRGLLARFHIRDLSILYLKKRWMISKRVHENTLTNLRRIQYPIATVQDESIFVHSVFELLHNHLQTAL